MINTNEKFNSPAANQLSNAAPMQRRDHFGNQVYDDGEGEKMKRLKTSKGLDNVIVLIIGVVAFILIAVGIVTVWVTLSINVP